MNAKNIAHSIVAYERSQEIPTLATDARIVEEAYSRGRASGLSLGRSVCELALQTGQSFDEICNEYEIARMCSNCGSIVRKLPVCAICDKEQ